MRTPSLWLIGTLLPAAAIAQVAISPGSERIAVSIGGRPFTEFHIAGADVTKPYLHPLRAASGTYITRAWPMENVAEEEKTQKDHLHQRGLWFAHEKVNGLDFWNNEASYTTPNRGKIVLRKVAEAKGGADRGTISATFDWTDLAGTVQLTESRVMTFYNDSGRRVIDFDITLTAVRPVVFGDSKDGVFGLRLRPVLQEDKGTGHIVNADGRASEKETWGKPSNWCDYSGQVGDEKLGVAILDHPANPHHPVRWHVRGYGLFAANPFGGRALTDNQAPDASVSLDPGGSLRFRYRLIVHAGDAKAADIAAEWQRYTAGK